MKAVILAVSLFLLLCFYSAASAQLTKMTVGYTALAAGQLPAWIAKESGIFRNNVWMFSSSISEGEPRPW